MLVDGLFITQILLRLIVGVRLVTLARQNNLPNFYWLALQFFSIAIGLGFATTAHNPLGNLPISVWLFTIMVYTISAFSVIPFNHLTFYRDRKSPFLWYTGICIAFTALTVYGLSRSEASYQQSSLTAFGNLSVVLVVFWHGWCAYRALAGLSKEPAVEDWIKSRYRLIILYSILVVIGGTSAHIRIIYASGSTLTPLGNTLTVISLLAHISALCVQFLVWVMPVSFRTWLNRNYQARLDEEVKGKATLILDILSSAMTEGTGLQKMMVLYALRKVIGDHIQAGEPQKIPEYVIGLSYNDWLMVLNNPELYVLIKNLQATADPKEILDKAKRVLIERQSLFTMQAT